MSLIDLPQAKWGSGTGRQVILKSDFDKIEQGVLEGFDIPRPPVLEYVDHLTVRVNATADCKARVMLNGFPSPLNPGQWVDGGLSDGRYRENAAPVTVNFATAGHLWGTAKPEQWYGIYALAGANDAIFSLKAMPLLRAGSQQGQAIALRNSGNTAGIGYGFTANELAGGQILVLSGASRGLARAVTANNDDNGSGGTITYGGSALTLGLGDWLVVLPATNCRYLGSVWNDAAGNLAPFYQDGRRFTSGQPRQAVAGPLNGFTPVDLGLVVPPTAWSLEGFATAVAGYDLKLAVSYDGSNPALLIHGSPPAGAFQGVRGATYFSCRVLDGTQIYVNNENTANQAVQVTGWRE